MFFKFQVEYIMQKLEQLSGDHFLRSNDISKWRNHRGNIFFNASRLLRPQTSLFGYLIHINHRRLFNINRSVL